MTRAIGIVGASSLCRGQRVVARHRLIRPPAKVRLTAIRILVGARRACACCTVAVEVIVMSGTQVEEAHAPLAGELAGADIDPLRDEVDQERETGEEGTGVSNRPGRCGGVQAVFTHMKAQRRPTNMQETIRTALRMRSVLVCTKSELRRCMMKLALVSTVQWESSGRSNYSQGDDIEQDDYAVDDAADRRSVQHRVLRPPKADSPCA